MDFSIYFLISRYLKNSQKVIDTPKARLKEFTEGLYVQMMHLGPYDTEALT